MEKLIEELDDKPPSAGWYPAVHVLSGTDKRLFLFFINRKYKRFFYHIKR